MNKKTLTFIWVCCAALLCSCSGKENAETKTRDEFIKVYSESPDKLIDAIQVPLEGVQDGKIHILTNVDLDWEFFMNPGQEDKTWIQIKSMEEVEKGHMVITYDAESLLDKNTLDWRGGRLSFYCPEQSLGKFMTVDQGYDIIFEETFDSEPQGNVKLTGKESHTTQEYPVLNEDFYDYISFNAWAETSNEFLSKNITLDVKISGGIFHDTHLGSFRVNVPLGTGPDKSNLKYLLILGNEFERFSDKTKFTFSTANDDLVYVHVDNFRAYKVTEADYVNIYGNEDDLLGAEEEEEWI